MKKKALRIITAIVAMATLFASVPLERTFAAGNTLLFSPSSQSLNINNSFTVNVKAFVESSGSGQVSGSVNFPSSLLRVTATSTSGSTYGNPAIAPGGGSVAFSGSASPGPTGLTQIFSITFQAIGAGTAQLTFSGDSSINGAAATRNVGTYTISNPNPPPPSPTPPAPTPPPTPPPTPVIPTPPPAPVETPPTDTTVKDNTTEDETGIITDVNTTPEYNKATVTWKHSREQVSTSLIYGGSRTTMNSTAKVTKQADGSFSAELEGLKPGVRYFFTITSEDSAKKKTTWDSVVVTRGYPVIISVTENEAAAANATVRIGDLSRTTGKDGTVTVELAEGNYNATITTESKTIKTVAFTVASKDIPTDGKTPTSQTYKFNLEATVSSGGGSNSILTFILVLLGGGAVLVLGVLGYLAYRRRQYEGSYGDEYVATGPSIVVDDGYNWQQQTPIPPTQPLPPPPQTPTHPPGAASDTYEEPKDMFELAREREERNKSGD